jgi:hypothetical protein
MHSEEIGPGKKLLLKTADGIGEAFVFEEVTVVRKGSEAGSSSSVLVELSDGSQVEVDPEQLFPLERARWLAGNW